MGMVRVVGMMAGCERVSIDVRQGQQRGRSGGSWAGNRRRAPQAGTGVGEVGLRSGGKQRRKGDADGYEDRFLLHACGSYIRDRRLSTAL